MRIAIRVRSGPRWRRVHAAVTAAGLTLLGGLLAGAPAARAGWEPAQPVDNQASGYGATGDDALAIGANGLSTILFLQHGPSTPSGSAGTPFEIRRAAGASTSWTAPGAVPTPAGKPLAPTALAAGSDGGTLGAFSFQNAAGQGGAVGTRWPAGAAAPETAAPVLCTSGSSPECATADLQVALDGAGNGYAVGATQPGEIGDVLFASTDPSTGAWQPAQVVAQSAGGPRLAVDAAGDVVVAYIRNDSTAPSAMLGLGQFYRVYGKRAPAGGGFGAERLISGGDNTSNNVPPEQTALVLDGAGNATVVFPQGTLPTPGNAVQAPAIFAVRWSPASVTQTEISTTTEGNAADPAVAVDPQGRVTAAWDASSPGTSVYARQSTPSGGWSASPQQLSPQNSPDGYQVPHVTVDADGTATVIYFDSANLATSFNLDAQILPLGGAWSAPVALGSTTSGAGSVQGAGTGVAAAVPGQADVAFIQALNGTNRLFATRFVDSTAPSIEIVTPQDGAGYKQGATVLADYSCTDPDSAVSSCAGPVANGQAIDTGTPGSHAFTVTASDPSGNTASKTVTYTVQAGPPPKDTAPPTVSISLPRNGAAYNQGQVVDARYSCSDPDLSSCTGTVAKGQPIDTRTTGVHSFSVTAQDVSGNTASETIHYTVVPHNTTSSCHARPISRIDKRGVRASRKGLNVSGTASEHVCAGASAATHRRNRVVKVYVMIYHPAPRGRCRFLQRNDTLTRPIPCTHPIELLARGGAHWSFARRIHIPAIAGGYLVRADAVDGFGRHQLRSAASVVHVVVR